MNVISPEKFAFPLSTPKIPTPTAVANLPACPPGMRNILVSADSLKSLPATLGYARFLAEHFGAKITVLYASGEAGSPLSLQELQETAIREAGIDAGQLRAVLTCPGGLSLARITNTALYEMADLIVIPADFHPGPRHFLQESALEKFLRHAPCPVLVVGSPAPRRAAA